MEVGFLAMGPGSGNCLSPIITKFKEEGYKVRLLALHDYVADVWGVELYSGLVEQGIKGLDLLFYGTGSGNSIELTVPELAKKEGVPTVSVLDIYWSSEEGLRRRYEYCPDYIIVSTDKDKKFLEDEYGERCKVLNLGNPHYERLQEIEVNREVTYPMDIAFLSQPSTEGFYSYTGKECRDAFKELLEVKKNTSNIIGEIKICIHPREVADFYSKNGFEVEKEDSFKVMLETDISIGCGTTLQYEALMLGKKTVFYKEGTLEEVLQQGGSSEGEVYNIKRAAKDDIFSYFKSKLIK